MWYIEKLRSKHYGTIALNEDGDFVQFWLGFKDYLPEEVSKREKESGWIREVGYDHVESIYDLRAAQVFVDLMNYCGH